MKLPRFISLGEQENDLLAGEMLLLETGFSAVKVFDRVALFESSLERLEHLGTDPPILVAANAAGDFRLLNANVDYNSDGFVIVSQITQRRPLLIVLSKQTRRQDEQHEEGFEQ